MYSIRLSRFCLIVTIICVQIHLNVSLILHDGYPLEDSRYMSSWRVQCRRLPPPRNGLVRVRNGGRVVRFQCKPGYVLLGEKRLVCRSFTWDKIPPQCIKPGCTLQQPTNGHVEQLYQGAVAKFSCYSGYLLSGPSVISCDGYSWNASTPACWRNEEETSIGSCDLEKGFCGWENGQEDEFDWKLNSQTTPSGLIGTGPSYDHTLGYGRKGHYLYLESSSPQRENDTAVLISPIFPAMENNETRCFTFWYHMHGSGIGKMNVYLNNTLNFTESGNHGNRWIRGIIPVGEDIFRLKIEGVRGPSYAGDIAIDDFAIAEGSACEETAPLPGNCNGRCFTETVTDDNACSCIESCQTNSTCCSDFYTLCTVDYGIPTAQAGLASSSSKPIDTSTDYSFLSTTSAQLINNSIDYSTTTVPLSPITTKNMNDSKIIPTTEQNYKKVDESQKNPVTDSTNLEQTNTNLKDNFTATTQQTTLVTTPNSTENSSTQKINMDVELKSVTNKNETIEANKTTYVNDNLSEKSNTTSNVILNRNNTGTPQVNVNTTKIDRIQTTTSSAIKFTQKSGLNQDVWKNQEKFESDYVVLKNMVEKLGKSPERDHIDSMIEKFLKQLKNREFENDLGENNFTTKNPSSTYTTRGEVTRNTPQLNTTTVGLIANFTLRNLARTTKIPFNLTTTTQLNNITTKSANRVTSTTKLNNITTKSANRVTSTTKLNNITTTTPYITRATFTPEYARLPGIRFKIPPKTSKSNTYFNPKLKNYVYSKNLPKLSTAKPVDRGLPQANNTLSTQKMNFYTTKNISRPTTGQVFVRATTQATHMSVIKTKVDVSGRSMMPNKNGKWKKFADKESHAPYVISQQTDISKSSIAIISVFSLLVIVCLVIAVFTCKKRLGRNRMGLDDDSDVQFLTSDELINFNLARPSPDRQLSSEARR